MSGKSIKHLKITNFKSIDSLELKDGLTPFTVFAGPNGSGKSNFFDALDFVSRFLRNGIEDALRAYGRFENIHSVKRRAEYARRFDFEIKCNLPDNRRDHKNETATFSYSLSIHDLDKEPRVEEYLSVNGDRWLTRLKGEAPELAPSEGKEAEKLERFPESYSALLFYNGMPLVEMLRNLRLYRIDPLGAKEPDQSDKDPTMLDRKGHNLASVLSRLEDKPQTRETILEWMETIVPDIEKIQTEQLRIEDKTAVLFKEIGTKRYFPAHMVSDGTIYALCLLVAVLDTPPHYGLTLIEEPERGLHPKAIRELIGLIREKTNPSNSVWVTTHSESVVRELKLQELVLVDKIDGRTKMKAADSGKLTAENLAPLNLDEAWLANLFDGGLPW